MARIRAIEVNNFRGIKAFTWLPTPGVNCLIGPGDSGKSSILDAIDFCLGARRNIQFTDADFHRLDVDTPISILVTIGELGDGLKNLDSYGMYLRAFDAETGTIEDEPEKDAEIVLTVKLTVGSDLEPSWTLVSERSEAQDQTRNLSWSDRLRVAPTRIDAMADYHLGWRRGSVLNRVSDERVNASAALAKAGRDVRASFGDEVQAQLGTTLEVVAETAKELGIPIGESVKAMLDAYSVSFNGGSISLHDENGVPLRGLGAGSTRLLIAGLHRKASGQATIILIDELEYGLEPHRIIRLLSSLGAKDNNPPLQVFMSTHSPVALRELSGCQLFVVRPGLDKHEVRNVGTNDDMQGTIRLYPDAFLAASVIVCEGASEVGFVRGMDQYRSMNGNESISAFGVALVDCGGGEPDKPFKRAVAFKSLGYRTAIIRDNDVKPSEDVERLFTESGGTVVVWRDGRALEDELFLSLTKDGVGKLVEHAVNLHGEDLINAHIKSESQNATDLDLIRVEMLFESLSTDSRTVLGNAAKKKSGWFKSVAKMEEVARDIVGPDLENSDLGFRTLVDHIFAWANNASK